MTTRAKSVRVVEQLATTSYKTCWDWLQKNLLFETRPDKNAYRSQLNGRLPLPSPPNLFCLEEKGV